MNVLVLYGGDSSERDISLQSGANVGEALQEAGHKVTYFDPASGMHTLSDYLDSIDIAFPILHGKGGEDGLIQKELERIGVPYVGSSSSVSAACFDKWETVQKAAAITFPRSQLVTAENIADSMLIKKAFVIKPRAEGSSVDTFIVKNPNEFSVTKLSNVFKKYNNELLIEQYISGTEITVAILGTKALPVIEIIPPKGQDFDFTNKYNGATKELCPPVSVSQVLQQKAQAIALSLHTAMGCSHLSRTDMIIDEKNDIYTLEINTLPGMTEQSLYPKAALAAGYTMPQLATELLRQAYPATH